MRSSITFATIVSCVATCGCEYAPYALGDPKTLLAIDHCSFYEQAFALERKFKGDPWWEVYVSCSLPETSFKEKIFQTRYPDLYRFSQSEAANLVPTVTIEYCKYRNAPAVTDVRRRVSELAATYEMAMPFEIVVVEVTDPCIAAGQELYE